MNRRGFTLLELMIVVAIIGVVSAMSVASLEQVGARGATQSASSDIVTLLQQLRARAAQRGTDIYVVIYPAMQKNGTITGGHGALVAYEDGNGDFLTSTGACDGTAECGFTNFLPPNNIKTVLTQKDRLIKAIYLDEYPKANVRFGKDSTAFSAPFVAVGTAADATGCSFCSSGRGVMVFTGDQQLRFLNGAGTPVAQRVAGIGLQAVNDPRNTTLVGLVAATGLVTSLR